MRALVLVWLALASCAIPDLSKIHLADCIRVCNATNAECLKAGSGFKCPKSDTCFDGVTKCFDDATACSDGCAGCEKNFTCEKESTCTSACTHQANDCARVIDDCVGYAQDCASAQIDDGKACVTDLVECLAVCVKDTEAVLRGK